jgi:cytochrome P450
MEERQATCKRVAELDLPHLAMETQTFSEGPLSYFEQARSKHPWLATSKFGLVVTEYTAMRDLYRQDDMMRPSFDGIVERLEAKGTPWGRFTEEQLIALPANQHRLLRNAFAAKFTPRFANSLRPMMRHTVTTLLDLWAPKGDFDFEEFASYFPISVMFALVGAPADALAGIRDDLEAIGLAMSLQKERMPRINEGMVRLESFVEDLFATRANNRRDEAVDLLDIIMDIGSIDGVTHQQLVDMVMFFFIAGYDTSKNVMTYTMYTLLSHPKIYKSCGESYEYCRKLIEEALRYFNPGTAFRFVDRDMVYRDVLLEKDTMLFFPLSVSGRDPGSFANASVFDPDRASEPNKRHIAFGLGKHMCLGQHIARAQLEEAFHQIPQRLKNPELAGTFGWRPFYGTWGLKGLPIRFTPAEAPKQ